MTPTQTHQHLTTLYGDPEYTPARQDVLITLREIIRHHQDEPTREPLTEFPEDATHIRQNALFVADHVREHTAQDIATDLSTIHHQEATYHRGIALYKAAFLISGTNSIEPALSARLQFLETALNIVARAEQTPIDPATMARKSLKEILDDYHMPLTQLAVIVKDCNTHQALLHQATENQLRWRDHRFYLDHMPHSTAIAFAAFQAGLDFVRDLDLLRQGAETSKAHTIRMKKSKKLAIVLQHMAGAVGKIHLPYPEGRIPLPPALMPTGHRTPA